MRQTPRLSVPYTFICSPAMRLLSRFSSYKLVVAICFLCCMSFIWWKNIGVGSLVSSCDTHVILFDVFLNIKAFTSKLSRDKAVKGSCRGKLGDRAFRYEVILFKSLLFFGSFFYLSWSFLCTLTVNGVDCFSHKCSQLMTKICCHFRIQFYSSLLKWNT